MGLDGFSERLRRMVNKPISGELFRRVLANLAPRAAHLWRVKFYLVRGYPTETPADEAELAEEIRRADAELPESRRKLCLSFHPTQFRSCPGTPAAAWPMKPGPHRGTLARNLARALGATIWGSIVAWEGRALRVVESGGAEGPWWGILDALVLRGLEADTETAEALAASRTFWHGNAGVKDAMAEKHVPARCLEAVTWRDLPTRYLETWAPRAVLMAADRTARLRAGAPWPGPHDEELSALGPGKVAT